MENTEEYLKPLPEGSTLCIYNGNSLVFKSSGKWLMPLFEAEKFFESYKGMKDDLRAHDTAIGKAAAVLMVRLGIKKIHGNLFSSLAMDYLKKEGIPFFYDNMVDRLMCATEDLLSSVSDIDEMYRILRCRARLVQGVPVEAREISSEYGNVRHLSFKLDAGDRLVVSGENGAGKSTLLRILSGILKCKEGSVLIDGIPVEKCPKYTIGYIPQATDRTQFSLSVEEVVGLGLTCRGKERKEKITEALRRTSSLNLLGRSFDSLSGGEKQKVSLSRCLAQNARLLLLDEPTAALDAENRKMVTDILRSLTISEIPTIILVTHDSELSNLAGWKKITL